MQPESNAVTTTPLVVVADDDEGTRRILADALAADGYEVIEYSRGDTLLEAITCSRVPALLVSDVCMPGESGLEVLRRLRETGSLIPVVLFTAFGSEELLNAAFRLGPSVVLSKPFAIDDMRRLVRSFLPRSHASSR